MGQWSCASLHSKANLLDIFIAVLSVEINLCSSGTALITNEKKIITVPSILWFFRGKPARVYIKMHEENERVWYKFKDGF